MPEGKERLEELVDGAEQLAVQLSPVKTARTEQNINKQLERLNETLDGANFESQFSGFLDNLTAQISEIVWRNTGGGK